MKLSKKIKRVIVNLAAKNNSSKTFLLIFGLALILSFFLYGNVLTGEFVYDDVFFSEREDLRHPGSLIQIWTQPYQPQNPETGGGFYRPLWVASLALNFIFFGTDTLSFHVVNTILYAAVLTVLFYLTKRLFNTPVLAFFAMLFFALLPIHSEVVANIKSRDELLAALFLLLSWYIFDLIEYVRNIKDWKIWLSAFFFLCSLFAKEGVILLPILFFSVWYIFKKPFFSEIVKTTLPFLVALAIYIPLRMEALGKYAFFADKSDFIMNQLTDVSFIDRLSTNFYLISLYIFKTFVPFNLSASYDYAVIPTLSSPFDSWISFAGVVIWILFIFLIFYPRTARPLRIGVLFFLLSYFVVSKILFIKGAIFGERFIFLGTVGISMVVGWLFYESFKRNRYLTVILLAVIAVIYSSIVIARNQVWLTEKGFFEQMVLDQPNSVQARNGLAQGYFKLGKLNDSYQHALAGYKIYPNHPPLVNLLGKLEYQRKNYSKSLFYFTEAIKLNNKNFENHEFYCYSLVKLKRSRDCIEHIEQPLKLHPYDKKLRFMMAVSLYKMGDYDKALLDEYVWEEGLGPRERDQILDAF